jgi:hypothetical protein
MVSVVRAFELAAKRYQAPGNGLKIKLLFQFDY